MEFQEVSPACLRGGAEHDGMRHYLLVANRTLDSPALEAWVASRLVDEPIHIHLVVPPSRAEGRIRWAEEEARDNARRRLARARTRLRAIGALVGGEIGPEDPLAAMAAALRRCPYDFAFVAA
ncbi:MAG: hypothetical protein QOJ23_5407 [Actinomycetota bacterium]|jgi:hypothetical protein|nr:hypothetical protein [Actinomycetota bacterium]